MQQPPRHRPLAEPQRSASRQPRSSPRSKMTKKTSPKASPKAATPKKANAFQMFLAEYKVGKASPYLEGARKVWNDKNEAAKSKYKEAATAANGSN